MNVGEKINYLTLIEKTEKRKGRQWGLFKCDCGNVKEIRIDNVTSKTTKACGCKKWQKGNKHHYIHGICYTRIYNIWEHIKKRCYNPKTRCYERYGGRGITMCDEWRKSPKAFYDWSMANGYADNLSIDRIDNNGNYEPSNCRWATDSEQSNNRRSCILITRNGKTQTMAQWCRELGIPYSRVQMRRSRGWSEDRLFD